MKHLLTGVAMAAALAIAAPAWAQSSSAPMTPPGGGAAKPGAAQPMAAKPMHRMYHHTTMHHHRYKMGEGDQMTEQLNQQELQRIMGGGAAGPAPAPMAPGGNNPTSGSAGPFAPSGSAPPPPAK
jgi:hypothetical protein